MLKVVAGVMDGTLEKSCDTDEIPNEDGKCNFEGATGWQMGETEDEIEICVDGNRKVFKKIDDLFTDLTRYKYCKRMRGTLPKSEIADDLLVLTNDRDLNYNDVMNYYMSSNEDNPNFYAITLESVE